MPSEAKDNLLICTMNTVEPLLSSHPRGSAVWSLNKGEGLNTGTQK